jgi:hypothetical protein
LFQGYSPVPTLTARENITLPVDIAGVKVDVAWFDTVVDTGRCSPTRPALRHCVPCA